MSAMIPVAWERIEVEHEIGSTKKGFGIYLCSYVNIDEYIDKNSAWPYLEQVGGARLLQ